MSSHQLNRRAVLAGTAAIVPATALAAVPALASPDAELIALGDELEALLRRYIPTLLGSCDSSWEAFELAKERAGVVEGVPTTDEQLRLWDKER